MCFVVCDRIIFSEGVDHKQHEFCFGAGEHDIFKPLDTCRDDVSVPFLLKFS